LQELFADTRANAPVAKVPAATMQASPRPAA